MRNVRVDSVSCPFGSSAGRNKLCVCVCVCVCVYSNVTGGTGPESRDRSGKQPAKGSLEELASCFVGPLGVELAAVLTLMGHYDARKQNLQKLLPKAREERKRTTYLVRTSFCGGLLPPRRWVASESTA